MTPKMGYFRFFQIAKMHLISKNTVPVLHIVPVYLVPVHVLVPKAREPHSIPTPGGTTGTGTGTGTTVHVVRDRFEFIYYYLLCTIDDISTVMRLYDRTRALTWFRISICRE